MASVRSTLSIRNYLLWCWNAPGIFLRPPNLLRQAVDIAQQRKGTENSTYMVSLHNHAGALIDSGDLNAAEERQVLAVQS